MLVTFLNYVQIIIIDILLSVDNVLFITLLTQGLSVTTRRWIVSGGITGAVMLRLILGIFAVEVLEQDYFRFLAGILLLLITCWTLYKSTDYYKNDKKKICSPQKRMSTTGIGLIVLQILMVDVCLSFDNILAIIAASQMNIQMMIFGVLLSWPFMLLGSEYILKYIKKYPIFLSIGISTLALSSTQMMLHDPWFILYSKLLGWEIWIYCTISSTFFLLSEILRWHHKYVPLHHN